MIPKATAKRKRTNSRRSQENDLQTNWKETETNQPNLISWLNKSLANLWIQIWKISYTTCLVIGSSLIKYF